MPGCVDDTMEWTNLLDFQRKLAQTPEAIADWGNAEEVISLLDVVKNAKPN